MKTSLRRVALTLATIVVLVLGGLLATAYYESSSISWPNEKFEQEKWATMAHLERYRLYKDLLRAQGIVGKSREEVQKLLGPPDKVAPDGSYVVYFLKDASGARFSFNAILFTRLLFDSQGIVREVRVEGD